MAVQRDGLSGSDHLRLLDAADGLIAALESARDSAELRHIREDFVQLQHYVEGVRRTVEHP